MTSFIIDNMQIPLPFGLRMQFTWSRILRFAAFSAEDERDASIALEREFKALIARDNATISKICFSYSDLWRNMMTCVRTHS